jgi:hypothetical protein
MKIKLHNLLVALKTLMLITHVAIIKTQETHLMQDVWHVVKLVRCAIQSTKIVNPWNMCALH